MNLTLQIRAILAKVNPPEKKTCGRPTSKEKRERIISLARANATLSMSAIALHVGCSDGLVAKVFKDRAQWYDL